MSANVHDIHIARNPICASAAIRRLEAMRDTMCMAKRRTFLREWRQHRSKTLVQVAEVLHMTHGNLSRIERGKVPYNQELLEALAEVYMCDPVDLLIRNPLEPESIWSLWDRAKPGQRQQITALAETILRTGTDG